MNKKDKMFWCKKNNGITLISLVITIVVMLILAGVAIRVAIDPEGLFSKTEEAKEEWNDKVSEEQDEMDKSLGMLSPLPENWDSKKIASTVKEKSLIAGIEKDRIVPIPKGYVASQVNGENTIAGGLVIYQGNDPVTGEKNSETHIEAMNSRNQFVWIPVDDINQMVMCQSNNLSDDGTICDLELEKDNKSYKLRCMTHNKEGENTTRLFGRGYIGYELTTNGNIHSTNANFDNRNHRRNSYPHPYGYGEEPGLISPYNYNGMTMPGDEDSIVLENILGLTSPNEFYSQLSNEYTSMAISVARYGGFFVSRYEVGTYGASKKNQKVLVAGNMENPNKGSNSEKYESLLSEGWYQLYKTLRTATSIDNEALNSHMIWGSQYDQMIYFLETDSKNEPQKGHLNRQIATQELTGANENDVMSNIYDLEGNNVEWTTAPGPNPFYRALRGGGFVYIAEEAVYYPSSNSSRGEHPILGNSRFSSRVTLYIN